MPRIDDDLIARGIDAVAPQYKSKATAAAELAKKLAGGKPESSRYIAQIAAFLWDREPKDVLTELLPSTPGDDVRIMMLADWARPWAVAIREELFGSPEPPFKTEVEAIKWLMEEEKANPPEKKDAGPSDEWRKRIQRTIKRWEKQGNPWDIGELELRGPNLIPYRGDDGWARYIPALGHKLSKLSNEANRMTDVIGWQNYQAMMYILIGAIPLMPRIRLEIKSKCANGEHGQDSLFRVWAELVISGKNITLRDFKWLLQRLRNKGLIKKRPIREVDARIYNFVSERRARKPKVTWEQIREQWARENPADSKHTTIRGLQKVIERAKRMESELR